MLSRKLYQLVLVCLSIQAAAAPAWTAIFCVCDNTDIRMSQPAAVSALHDTGNSNNTSSVQHACCAETGIAIGWKAALVRLIFFANKPACENEKTGNKTLFCTNTMSTNIARDGSLFNIIISHCTCMPKTSRHAISSAHLILITAATLHQFLQCAYDLVDNLITTVYKSGSALRSYFGTSSYPMSAKYSSSAYTQVTCHATVAWWYNACLISLDYIKQSSTFCSQDHYRPYQKLTFYNSAIGIPPPFISGPDGMALASPVEHPMYMGYGSIENTIQNIFHTGQALLVIMLTVIFLYQRQLELRVPCGHLWLAQHSSLICKVEVYKQDSEVIQETNWDERCSQLEICFSLKPQLLQESPALSRNCPEYELLHRREAADYFHLNRKYALKEPTIDAEEELTEASQWLNSDRRQWSQADNAQVIFSPSEVSQFMTGCHHQHVVNKPLMTRSLYGLPVTHGTFEDVKNNLQSEYSGKQAENVEELVRNCPEYESFHRREDTHYFHPNREYVLKEPSVDAEEVFTEASQWLKSDERQWSLADDGQAISSPCKTEDVEKDLQDQNSGKQEQNLEEQAVATKKYSEVSQDANWGTNYTELVSGCTLKHQLPQESTALCRNSPEDEFRQNTFARDFSQPKLHYEPNEPSVDTEEEQTDGAQNLFLSFDERQRSLAGDKVNVSNPFITELKQADPIISEEYELSDVSDVVRVQKSPELNSSPCEDPVLRRHGFEDISTPFAAKSVLTELLQADLISWEESVLTFFSKTPEVLRRHGFEKESRLLAVLAELQQADLITSEECERLSDISGMVNVQKGKSPEVISKTAEVLRRHGFDEESRLLAGYLPCLHDLVGEEWLRFLAAYHRLKKSVGAVVKYLPKQSRHLFRRDFKAVSLMDAKILDARDLHRQIEALHDPELLQQLSSYEEDSLKPFIVNFLDRCRETEVQIDSSQPDVRLSPLTPAGQILGFILSRKYYYITNIHIDREHFSSWDVDTPPTAQAPPYLESAEFCLHLQDLYTFHDALSAEVETNLETLSQDRRCELRRVFQYQHHTEVLISRWDACDHLHRTPLFDPLCTTLLRKVVQFLVSRNADNLSSKLRDYEKRLATFVKHFLLACHQEGVVARTGDVSLNKDECDQNDPTHLLAYLLTLKPYYVGSLCIDESLFTVQTEGSLQDERREENGWMHASPFEPTPCTSESESSSEIPVATTASGLFVPPQPEEKRKHGVDTFTVAITLSAPVSPVSVQFQESGVAGLAQPASDTATTYLAELHPQYDLLLQPLLRCYTYSPLVAAPSVSCYYLVPAQSAEDVHPSLPNTVVLEKECYLQSDPTSSHITDLFVPPQPKEKEKHGVDTFTVPFKLSAPGEDENGEDDGENTTAERKQVGNHMTSHITTPTEDGVVNPQGDRTNALPLCPESAISNHPEAEAAYQNVGVCPPPWPPPISVQFQESRVAGLAQPASDVTAYLARLSPQYVFLQPLLHSCSYSYYSVPEPQPQNGKDIHPSIPSTVVLETACSLESDATLLEITEQPEADEVFPTQESFGARAAQLVGAVIPILPGEDPVSIVESREEQCEDQCLCKVSKVLPLTTFPIGREETITKKGKLPFQLIGETNEIVTGRGEFLFQQFLENENGELVFPEVLFSEAGHQAAQLHYSTSRSHPTAGNFAKSLIDWSAQGKGDGCTPKGAQAAPASGKGFLDCIGVSKIEQKLVFATLKGSDDENDGAITTCLPETQPEAEPHPFPRDTQPQHKPQEVASNCRGEKLPKCSKKSKPPHENVDPSDTNEARQATDRNCVAATTLSRKKTGENTGDMYVLEKPPYPLQVAAQREQLTAEGRRATDRNCVATATLHRTKTGANVSEKPNSVQVAAQREQLTENSPVASSRPGKRAGALDTKPKAELRQPNEPHTAIVGSATAPPPGRREAPVGRESVKVPAVQAAPHPLAQASDQGYGTGTGSSSRNTLVTAVPNVDDVDEVDISQGAEVATRSQSTAEPVFAHTSVADAYKDEQYCMAHISLNPQPNTVHRSELTNGKTKRVSPMLKVLLECPNPRKYFDPDKLLEALQLNSLLPRNEVDTSLYIRNRAKLEQMYPYLPQGQKERDTVAGVVYSTLKYTVSEEKDARAVIEKFAVNLRTGWNALKDCPSIKYLKVESLAKKLVPHESMADWTEKKNTWRGIAVELRYFLKLEAERNLTRPRVVHALFVTDGNVEFIHDVMSAGLSLPRDNPTLPEIQEFLSGIQEPLVFDKIFTEIVEFLKIAGEWGVANELQESRATKSSPMHLFGVWLATAAASTRPATWADFVQLLRKTGVDEGVVQTVPGGPWDSHQSDVFHISVGQQPPVTAKAVQELSTKQVDEPRAWNERMLASANERNRDIEDVDAKHSARSSADQQSSDSADKSKFYIDPPSSSNVDARSQGVGIPSQSGSAVRRQPSQAPHTNQPVPRVTATTSLSNREKEEEHYLSLPLDPSDVKSILYHAKAVYLTLDYNNTRRILDILAHHLLIDEELLRAKVFGYAISYYRQRNFPPALERLDELEKLALEHHSAGDVSLSCIYRGEIYMAQKKLDQAFRMFDHARATYDENNVSMYYGIIILSKCAVMVKAANCQKQLMDYRKAKEVYHMAIEFAERVRLTKEALPLDEPDRKSKVEASYRDEITARCSLGNLFQNMSDCANALEQYEVVLHLQGKIEGDRAALGWAEGNYGNALLGLNRLKEAIPHLQRAFELARKNERGNQGISRAASNLGNALQAAKQYADAQNSFEIALGHSVFSGDEVGHARALGNLGNVKLVTGEPLEALRYYNEALSLNSDDTSLYTAYQNRASVYITLAAKVNEGVGEWDEVPEDIMAEEPREAISIQLPVEEQTKEVGNFRCQHMVLPSGRTLPRGGLDDSEEYFKGKDGSPSQSEVLSVAGSSVPSAGGPPPSHVSSTLLGTSHTHYLRHRKFYLRKAEEDLRKVANFVEDRFAKVKGKEGTNSLALSIFEANSKAFYGLQKVLVCLGHSQEALKIAEANRARNLGEVMLSAKKNSVFTLSSIKVPLDLSTIWSFANSEQTPVAVLSCDVSCILVHIIVPRDEQSSLVPVGGYGRQQNFANALMRGSEETIPANCYHFFKIELFTDTFTDEWSRSREARPSSDNVTFEQYVTKNLMDFLNAKETNLFEPVDFEPRDNPLTVLFDQFARKFAEVIEATAPEFHELVVIADQALHLLPWPVLQDKTSRKFLGDRYRIRTYPSILTMGVISSQSAPLIILPSEERFLVVGNPAIPKFINQKKEVSLGRLPHAEDEATQVSHILETKPLLREQATKQTVIYRLQMANLVHIATHGSGSQGYIALASNMPVLSSTNAVDAKECLLFIDEIQRLHISASLVVLSACDSARGEIVNEGVNSVARAILAAGAQSVLVSLVRVPDKSASIFMRLFYRFLAHDGMTTSEALQKSSMGVRCIKSLSQHVHWGGFQLIGRNIKIAYNNASNSAKVATLVGDPTPFPRLELLQQLEKAIFRNDRTPPRDVVLVKGMSFYDPAEVVRDFICKHFKHYPGGVFWYNAASEDLLDASVSFVKQTVPHLKTIQREPSVEKAIPDKKKKTLLDGSGGESYDNHYRLIVLDHPASMASCLAKIPEIHSSHSDVIVIHTADTDRDQSLTRWVDEQLVRGCTSIVAGPLDKYDSIQRMAYSILRDNHITPYEEDYEAFDVLQQFCHGSSSLVRLLEGMLCREEAEIELRQLASDVTDIQNKEPDVITRLGQQDLPQTRPAAEKKGSSLFKRSSKSKDRARGEGKARNGYIRETPELTAEDHVRLSNDHEKPARLFFPIGTLLETRITQEEHFLLTALGYLTLYPKSHSEGTFTFTNQFLNQLATVITDASGRTTEPHFLVNNLAERHVIRQYPLPVLSPPDYESTFKLFYVPDSIVRAVTFDLDQGDEAFILTACSSAVQHLSELHSYHSALKNKVALLYAESGLPSLQQ